MKVSDYEGQGHIICSAVDDVKSDVCQSMMLDGREVFADRVFWCSGH